MLNIKKQISRLYLSSILGNLSLTGAWVAILAARGYSLVEIGFAETIFHITSLLLEIPSGVLADVFGRKKMLIVSTIMTMVGNIIMIFSSNLFLICASMIFQAASYNFLSGSGDALAYDSLKMVSREAHYEKYASNQMVIYRLCGGISTLCAGFALLIGHRAAYSMDLVICIIQIGILTSLQEISVTPPAEKSRQAFSPESTAQNGGFRMLFHTICREMIDCFVTSLSFLKTARRAILLMCCNSLVGAIDILLLFFLQAKLPESGMSASLLGFALFFMETGGLLGARIILKCGKLRYRSVFIIAAMLVLTGVLAEHSGSYLIMTAGGFLAALGDDALQVRTNTILQDLFPSQQRATLISIESFTFSMIMIVLSPLAGVLFSQW
ncbi:MAG: MFS transporter [Lachnospiraceae bacterium]